MAALLRTCLQGVLLKENSQTNSSSQAEKNPIGQRKKDLGEAGIIVVHFSLKWKAECNGKW